MNTLISIDKATNDLLLAKTMLDIGNMPQAELFVRRHLHINPESSAAKRILSKISESYEIPEGLTFSEEKIGVDIEKKYLLIKAWGYGFWSEIHHLLNQLLVAELTHRTPIVLWGGNCIFRNKEQINSFDSFYEEISSVDLDVVIKTATIFPEKWNSNNIYSENNNKWNSKNSRIASQYLLNRSEKLVVSDFYTTLSAITPWIGEKSQYRGLNDDEIYQKLYSKYLNPSRTIQLKSNSFYDQYMQGKIWVAIHMRGTDKIHESPNIENVNLNLIKYLDIIISNNPTIGVFLLTDSISIENEFTERYGKRLLLTNSTRDSTTLGVHNSGHDGIKIGEEVLVDAVLATKCDFFLGNMESNVAVAISSMKKWSQGFIHLVGSKNIRSENTFLHNDHIPEITTHTENLKKNNLQAVNFKKSIVQVLKSPLHWTNSPPGLGDFIRGACHLIESYQKDGVEFKIDISQTEFSDLIEFDKSLFTTGKAEKLNAAEEYFTDHVLLTKQVDDFIASNDKELFITTNLGDWNRLTLPHNVSNTIKKFYKFNNSIEEATAAAINTLDYEVLSIRCGDQFFNQVDNLINKGVIELICKIIENNIIPNLQYPLVVTSDSYALKNWLAEKYRFIVIPHQSQHGAFGNARPVAMDLCMLKNSKYNYHINSWATWWSGFSHYTSIIFNIPSMNFRAPDFIKEEISKSGVLISN